jgi:hypothetical protein
VHQNSGDVDVAGTVGWGGRGGAFHPGRSPVINWYIQTRNP